VSQQEELAETREQVLMNREKVISSAKRVREQRYRTGATEVELMNALRNHYNSLGVSLPSDLIDTYSSVDNARTKLTELEEDHVHIAQELGVSEWALIEQENDLYQYNLQQLDSEDIPYETREPVEETTQTINTTARAFPPSISVQHQVAVMKYSRLTRHFNTLRKDLGNFIGAMSRGSSERTIHASGGATISEFVKLFSDALEEMTECALELQQLKPQLKPEVESTLSIPCIRSEAGFEALQSPRAKVSPTRAHSDGSFSNLAENVSTGHIVEDWLLDGLRTSAMEKVRYLLTLRELLETTRLSDINFDKWEERIVRSWSKNSLDSSIWSNIRPSLNNRRTSEHSDLFGIRGLSEETYDVREHAHSSIKELYLDVDADYAQKQKAIQDEDSRPEVPLVHIGEVTVTQSPQSVFGECQDHSAPVSDITATTSIPVPDNNTTASSGNQGLRNGVASNIDRLQVLDMSPSRCDSAQNSELGERWPVDLSQTIAGDCTQTESALSQQAIGDRDKPSTSFSDCPTRDSSIKNLSLQSHGLKIFSEPEDLEYKAANEVGDTIKEEPVFMANKSRSWYVGIFCKHFGPEASMCLSSFESMSIILIITGAALPSVPRVYQTILLVPCNRFHICNV
jgi:hypothetical protein